MKCTTCQAENRDDAKKCKKCGMDLTLPAAWKPSWKWHLNVLLVIGAFLIVTFFALNILLKPYMRTIPQDVTPWLKKLPAEKTTQVK